MFEHERAVRSGHVVVNLGIMALDYVVELHMSGIGESLEEYL